MVRSRDGLASPATPDAATPDAATPDAGAAAPGVPSFDATTATVLPRSPAAGPSALSDEHGPPGPEPSRQSRTARSGWLVWVVAVLGFFLVSAGWALAAPWNGTYDEDEHIIRAAGAARGQFYVPPEAAIYSGGGFLRVPRSLVPPDSDCMITETPRPPATCQGTPPSDRTRARTPSAAARYNPVYYAVVGLPTLVSPTMAGVVGARLVSGLLSALFLGTAMSLAWAYRRTATLLPAAVLLVATPMVANLAGSVNPNGLEISAAIALWVALGLLALTDRLDEAAVRRLLWVAGVAGAVVLTLRQIGPLLVAVPVLACVLAARPGRLRDLVGRRSVRVTAAALTVVGLAGVAWTLLSGLLQAAPLYDRTVPRGYVAQLILTERSGDWVRQFVARFYGSVVPPVWSIYLWFLLVGAVVVPCLLVAGRRVLLAVTGTAAAAAVLAVTLEFLYFDDLGASQQGRYYLPLVAGVLLLPAAAPGIGPRLGAVAAGRLTLACAVLTGLVHLLCLLVVLGVWRNGAAFGVHPFSGPWRPIVGSVVPLVTLTVGALLLVGVGLVLLRDARRREPPLSALEPDTAEASP